MNSLPPSAQSQYLALVFSESWVSAAVWQQLHNETKIIAQSRLVPMKSTKDNDVNPAVDTALDDLGDSGLSLKHVLYVLPAQWIQHNDVIHEKKTLTQKPFSRSLT